MAYDNRAQEIVDAIERMIELKITMFRVPGVVYKEQDYYKQQHQLAELRGDLRDDITRVLRNEQ